MHDFSVCLKTGFNPADSNRLQSHTEKMNKTLDNRGIFI